MREISSEIELGHRLDTPMSSCSMQPIRAIVILLIPCGHWILPCPQGINDITMAVIGCIEQLDMGVSNR